MMKKMYIRPITETADLELQQIILVTSGLTFSGDDESGSQNNFDDDDDEFAEGDAW